MWWMVILQPALLQLLSALDFVEVLCPIVPLVLNDHLLELELVLGPSVHQIKDGIQVFAHLSISCLEGLNAIFVELAAIITDH